jgi:hypothetical protein
MPLYILKVSKLLLFIQRFLQIIFTKHSLPGVVGLANCTRWLGFTDSDQAHSLWFSTGFQHRTINSFGDFLQLVVYLLHIV